MLFTLKRKPVKYNSVSQEIRNKAVDKKALKLLNMFVIVLKAKRFVINLLTKELVTRTSS